MKILFDARMVKAKTHGIGRYTLDLINGLSKLDQRISILSPDKNADRFFEPQAIDKIFYHPTPFASPQECLSLSRPSYSSEFDVIHYPSFAVPLFAPWKKVVITMHDLIHVKIESSLKYKIYYNTVLKRALEKAGAIITVSNWTKSEVIKYFKIPDKKIFVVRNGVNHHWIDQDLGLPEKKEVSIISISNIKPHKNILTLITACRDLWRQNIAFKLKLVLGEGPLPTSWNLTSEETEKIVILKNLDDKKLKYEILNSCALVSPSLMEGFDYPVAETLSLGQKVILSKGSAHDEFQSPNATFYGAPMDIKGLTKAIYNALTNVQPLQKVKSNIGSTSKMAQETLDVYKGL